MTLHDSGNELKGEQHKAASLHARLIGTDSPDFARWLLARQELVESKGWETPSGEEYDRYDDNPHTKQLVLFDEKDELIFGMRLTPVEGFKQALSWEMVRPSTIHAQAELAGELDPAGQVWDLTRLAPGHDIPYRVRHDAIPRLFGEGLRECVAAGDHDPVWVFTLDEVMAKWLERQGVDIRILGSAVLPGGDEVSSFGYFRPARLASRASLPSDGTKASDFAHRAMREGHI